MEPNEVTIERAPLIIYHANCWDGAAAAWAILQRYPTAEALPWQYYSPPPSEELVTGRDVYIVDFSFSAEAIREIARYARRVVVLDHHKTARANLEGQAWPDHVVVQFDMERSGCRMAWEFVAEGKTIPQALAYIEDRDLWRFALPDTKPFMAWLGLEAPSIKRVKAAPVTDTYLAHVVSLGDALLELHQQYVAASTKEDMVSTLRLGPDVFPCVVTSCPALISDIGHALATRYRGVAAVIQRDPWGEARISLRASADSSVDVSEIAKRYGGGGHAKAAGLTLPLGAWGWDWATLTARDTPG